VPEPTEDHTIATLQASIHLRQIQPRPILVVGEQVYVPFAGLSGIVLRQKNSVRVVITLNLLMQSIAVEVNIDDLEHLSQFIPAVHDCARTNHPQTKLGVL
jgi:hypothetical protein